MGFKDVGAEEPSHMSVHFRIERQCVSFRKPIHGVRECADRKTGLPCIECDLCPPA